jgi:transposase
MSRNGIEVRQDMTATVLRKKARTEKDVLAASRMLGIANILDGMDRASAAKAAGMDRQTLRDWVHRYNRDGLAGLYNRPKGHPRRSLTREQEKEVETMVSAEPEGVLVRWRRKDIKAEIEKRYGVVLTEMSVGRMLRRLGFCRMSVRPVHPKNDPEAIETFKKTSPRAWRKSSPNTPKAKSSSSGSKTKQGSDKKAR